MAHLLTEDGGRILLEDGSGSILLEGPIDRGDVMPFGIILPPDMQADLINHRRRREQWAATLQTRPHDDTNELLELFELGLL